MKKTLLAACILFSFFMFSACAVENNCQATTDCRHGSFCLNGKCTRVIVDAALNGTSDTAILQDTTQPKEPVVEVTTLCDNSNPEFSPSNECYNIRAKKYADRMVCDYTIGPPTWYNMGSCYNCIVSCR
jgi:hypothetical protein